MADFSGPYEAFTMDSVGIRDPISDIQDQKSQYDVSKHPADRQYIEFAREYGVISSEEALMSWYESTMESFGLKEVIDPIMIKKEHVSEALYGPSFGVDNGERLVYPETKSTVDEKGQDCDANNLQKHTPGHEENLEVTMDKEKCIDKPLRSRGKGKGHTANGKKKRKTDQYVGGNVVEIYPQKSKRSRCKSSQRLVYPETKSTVDEKGQDCNANNLQKHTPGHEENLEVTIDKPLRPRGKGKGHTANGKKKRKTDQYVGGSVVEIYPQKSKRGRCKSSQSSSACTSRQEKSNTSVIRSDPPELPLHIVRAEDQKDYTHLRARRGQATNSHSLAERVRRQKINERMKVLQELVPGCSKVIGKALVLEEIIKYVQFLQKQVEILSWRLSCLVPLWVSELEVNGHLSAEWSNLKLLDDNHGITMAPQTLETFYSVTTNFRCRP